MNERVSSSTHLGVRGDIAGNRTMVMGDMVLSEDQVNPAMSTGLDNGLEVTALHNHFLWDSPKVMFMHIGGMDDEEKLAAVGKLFANMKQTSGGKGEVPTADVDPTKSTLDSKKVEAILGKDDLTNGVYKVTIGRETKMHGQTAGNIVAIHQHMAGEVPRALFLHFWGVGGAESLAKGIKAALETQK
jgi:hypothetical protein